MYNFEISESLEQILVKVLKKNKALYEQIKKKMDEIINSESIERYKNLKYKMKESKRVHIGHFVLIFKFNPSQNTIVFEDFNHHDDVYEK